MAMVTLAGTVTRLGSLEVTVTVRAPPKAVGIVSVPASVPTPSVASLGAMIVNGGSTLTVTLNELVAVCGGEAESATVTEKLYPPVVVGVPLSTPAVLSESQDGKPVADQVSLPTPPLAVNVTL